MFVECPKRLGVCIDIPELPIGIRADIVSCFRNGLLVFSVQACPASAGAGACGVGRRRVALLKRPPIKANESNFYKSHIS
ncbi:hypothetical protein EVAR_14113_1 [Eumeta japonica]|uniref:Uncharacterized protein n=1 Tax=Eumeta variegata TaxID=151549 RepID=A0A4C1UPL8_EUMVA|nr:hypothetical protein EVAR_14113_1 [Eumeta japonica]